MLPRPRLQEILVYDPASGDFFWRVQRGSRSDLVGKPAGWLHRTGYRHIEIDGKHYAAHRLAWLYVYGDWPKAQIDHINRTKSDNRITNLRLANNRQNGANSKAKPSFSGLKGAHWHSRDKKWFAHIWHNGKRVCLGHFPTANAAHDAYCAVAKKLHGEFFHSGHTAA